MQRRRVGLVEVDCSRPVQPSSTHMSTTLSSPLLSPSLLPLVLVCSPSPVTARLPLRCGCARAGQPARRDARGADGSAASPTREQRSLECHYDCATTIRIWTAATTDRTAVTVTRPGPSGRLSVAPPRIRP